MSAGSDWRDDSRLVRPRPDDSVPTVDEVAADPIGRAEGWLVDAVRAGIPLAPAMTLATWSPSGGPSARTVVLLDLSARGFRFQTSAGGPAGRDLDVEPRAAVVLHWRELSRQLRAGGTVLRLGVEESADDLRRRHPSAQAETLAWRQSEPAPAPDERERLVEEAARRLEQHPGALPGEWSSYVLVPEWIEFWSEDSRHRQHRVRCTADGSGGWRGEELWP